MNLEELTKQQIILLTLLVSFVTSIATGIVTVTLMDQAPSGITRTINRVVERTIEKVVPDEQGASVIMTEKTVIVKEDDLITELIKNGSKNIVRVYKDNNKKDEEGNDLYEGDFIGIGTIISSKGDVVLDGSLLNKKDSYYIKTYDNKFYDIEIKYFEKDITFVNLVKKDAEEINLTPIKIIKPNLLKLGQSVVVINEGEKEKIWTGIISSFTKKEIEMPTIDRDDEKEGNEEIKTVEIISKIETNMTNKISTGTPLFNFFGDVIAIAFNYENGEVGFIPVTNIKEEFNNLKEKKLEKEFGSVDSS